MVELNVGDKVKVKAKSIPGGYGIADWEGTIVEVKSDPAGYVIMKADKTGYNMAFRDEELTKI